MIDHVSSTALPILLMAGVFLSGCPSRPGNPADPQTPACLERAIFGRPKDSLYVLPYATGSAYEVFQTYCGPVSHGRDGQMAIDFLMPKGTEILAARGGIVRYVIDHNADAGRRFNAVYIEHEDGTVAFYGHLQQDSAKVEVGDRIVTGQPIALSGSSGTSLEHLHFGVASSWPIKRPDDVPVNFHNTDGLLDERGGLQRGILYRADPY